MKNKLLYIFIVFFFIFILNSTPVFAADPKLVTTITKAFERVEGYLLRISTPAAAVAVGSGLIMKKFSFGDEEKMRTSKKIIRGSLFSYAFILCIDLILSLIQTILN